MRTTVLFLILFVVFFGFPYIILPLILFFGKGTKAQFNVDAIAPDKFLPDARFWVSQQVKTLESLGFTVQHYLLNRDAMPNVRTYFVLLANLETQDKAMVTAMYTVAQNGTTPGTRYVEFSTKFVDDTGVDTMNSSQALAFKQRDDMVTTRLPGLDDVPLLFRIHQYLMAKNFPGKAKKLPAPGDEIPELQRGVRRSYEKQTAFGLMEYLSATDSYKQTLWGAFFMVYRQLFPVAQYELMRDKNNASVLKKTAQDWQPGQPIA